MTARKRITAAPATVDGKRGCTDAEILAWRAEAGRAAQAEARRLWPQLRRRCRRENWAAGMMAKQEMMHAEGRVAAGEARRLLAVAGFLLRVATPCAVGLAEEARRLCARAEAVAFELAGGETALDEELRRRVCRFSGLPAD